MTNITATIEYVRHGEAVVTLSDTRGEYGCTLVQCRSGARGDLYEAGYRLASLDATSRGGRLDAFTEVPSPRVSYVALRDGIYKQAGSVMTGPYTARELGLSNVFVPECGTLECGFREGASISFGFGYGNRSDNGFAG